jgi:hypothetical protein
MTDKRKRSRLMLVLLAVLFAAPVVAAIVLHAIGWEPTKTRNHGTLLQPPPDLRAMQLQRADGTRYEWEPQARRWRIAVVPPALCDRVCVDLVSSLDKVWQLQGRRADRLDVLWFGELPADAVAFRRLVPMKPDAAFVASLPDADADARGQPPLYLIDPSGFLAMRYAPGADVAGVREDVARLLK